MYINTPHLCTNSRSLSFCYALQANMLQHVCLFQEFLYWRILIFSEFDINATSVWRYDIHTEGFIFKYGIWNTAIHCHIISVSTGSIYYKHQTNYSVGVASAWHQIKNRWLLSLACKKQLSEIYCCVAFERIETRAFQAWLSFSITKLLNHHLIHKLCFLLKE